MDSNNNDSDDNESILNEILGNDDASTIVHGQHLNPATTEHLKLFNPTFKKKKGPPKKVDIIDPQEFKNPQKAIESVINSNVSHELVPSLSNKKSNAIKDMISKASEEIKKELFLSYDENIPENETNTFHSSVEVLLREIKFQEEFINPNIHGFRLNGNKNLKQTKQEQTLPFDLKNYQFIEAELSPEDLKEFHREKEEVERIAQKRRAELEQEIQFAALRKKVEFEKHEQERRDKYNAILQKSLERVNEMNQRIEKEKKEARLAEEEKERAEQEKIKWKIKTDREAAQAMKAAVKLLAEEELAKKNAEDSKKIAIRKQQLEEEAEERKRKTEEYFKIIEENRQKAHDYVNKQKERYENMKKEAKRIEEERKKAE